MLVVGCRSLHPKTCHSDTLTPPELPPTVLTRSHVVVSCPLWSRPQHTQSSDNLRGGQLQGGLDQHNTD